MSTYQDVLFNPTQFQRWQQLEVFCNQYFIDNNYIPLNNQFEQIDSDKYMQRKIDGNTKYHDGLFMKDQVIYVLQCKCLQHYTEHLLGINDLMKYCQGIKNCCMVFGVDNNFKLQLTEYPDVLILKFDQVVKFSKPTVELKSYQQKFVDESLQQIINNKNVIINCMCRFGKSYIMKYLQEYFNWDVFILTTKPTETQSQYNDLSLKWISIQRLKVNDVKIECDVLFIDEPQESFMTELSESKIDLASFRKIIYFTGTSQKLQLYLDNYVICHYNFGDYVVDESDDKPKFPKIKFHLGLPENYSDLKGITLIFDRSKTLQQLRKEEFIVQSSQDESDLLSSSQGVYLLNQQFTTGITIQKCFNVVIRHSNFTETDIQSVFRCFNDSDLNIQRNVFVKDKQMLKDMMIYIYRQTGKNYINNFNLQILTKELFEKDIEFKFDMIDLQMDNSVIIKMFKQFAKYKITNQNTFENITSKNIQEIIQSIKPRNETQRLVMSAIKKPLHEVDERYLILMTRLIIQLAIDSYQLKLKTKINKNNQDYSAVNLWNQMEEYERLNQIFNGFIIGQDTDFDNQNCLSIIFVMYDKFNKTQMIKYIYELIQNEDVLDKYEKLQYLYKTTLQEQKVNAEILTPDWLVDEMIEAFIKQVPKFDWKKSKIIEPCCGKGAFLIGLYKRGIIRNVDWNDINPVNVQFCNLLFNTDKGTVMDALKIDYSKYDLVITNPPYNSEANETGHQQQIYQKFSLLFQRAKYSVAVIKANWCLDQRKMFKQFRKEFVSNLLLLKHFKQQIFDDTDIKGGVVYYINKQDHKGQCVVNDIAQQLNEDQQLFINGDLQIPDDLLLNHFTYLSRGYFLKLSYQDQFQENEFVNSVQCVESIQHGQKMRWISKELLVNSFFTNKWICVTPTAATGSGQGIIRYAILKPGQIFSQSYIGFVCDSEKQAKQLGDYLLSEQSQDIIKKIKQTQDVSKKIFEYHPYIKELFE